MPENEIVVKTDLYSVGSICNSLNAWMFAMRHDGYHALEQHLLDAQRLIWTLYRENQELKGNKKEDHE